ncbi:DUF1016 N-terminal domain-containing protein [Chryseobacterium sp. KMC2]|uniref:DUF1016 N-terminal domain-containing protein n=1 Tax=Chryseobacterium sp. KMC2 TaxID=2800705 RepID=UPI001F45584C|nr:DUF1016 N-terminal domain-containing protein [Chryseobacterium sp. KMC2]
MEISEESLFQSVKEIIRQSREKVFRIANSTLLLTYWQIGKLIVEDEQQGKERAEYGKYTLKNLSQKLTLEFGKGFDYTNLSNMRKFYIAFPIVDTLSQQLSWSHYQLLSSQDDKNKRQYYPNEAVQNNWNVRDLKRQMNSLAYERVLKHKESSPESIYSVLKDTYIFEFFGIKADEQFSEKDETIVKYSVFNDKNNLFASKYLLYLPKEELNKSSIRTEFVLN